MEQTSHFADNDPLIFAVIVLLVLLIHFIPSYVAFARNHTRRKIILVLNILMGWTVIGWAALLFWASKGKKSSSILG